MSTETYHLTLGTKLAFGPRQRSIPNKVEPRPLPRSHHTPVRLAQPLGRWKRKRGALENSHTEKKNYGAEKCPYCDPL